MTASARSNTMRYFEKDLKFKFYPEEFEDDYDEDAFYDYLVPVPGVADDVCGRIEDGYMELSTNELKEIFEPTLRDIAELIETKRSEIEAEIRAPVTVSRILQFSAICSCHICPERDLWI